MSFSCQKKEFDRFFNRLDRPVEESRPDRPVDPTGAGRADRFPSLTYTMRLLPVDKIVQASQKFWAILII